MTEAAASPAIARRDRCRRVVFPTPDELRLPLPLRNVSACALLRLSDDSVRFLRATTIIWTDERLDAVEQWLERLDSDDPAGPELARRVAYELGIPSLTLVNARLDCVDPVAWDLRRTAVAAVARTLCRHSGHPNPAGAVVDANAIEQRFLAALTPALAAFVDGLDPEAQAIAQQHRRFDVASYNFLARRPHRAWRQQFVQTFPLLVHVAVTGPRGSGGANIRALVDGGRPLVKHLAARWTVVPGTLRCLRGRAVDVIGAQWQEQPHALARILDALRPEDRPGDDAAAWRRLADAVTTAEAIFRRPVTSSPVTLGWLREAARRGFARLDGTRTGRRLPAEAIPLIDRLRAALVEHLAGAAGAACAGAASVGTAGTAVAPGESELRALAAAVADHELALLHPARLAAIARTFALEHASRRASLDDQRRDAQGAAARYDGRQERQLARTRPFWPLLPRDYISTATERRVIALATREDLRREGIEQDLCIRGGRDLTQTVDDCASGRAYLLSVRQGVTGAALSTAEVYFTRGAPGSRPQLRVRQHKGRDNALPSTACAAALREALAWVASREVQEHLEEGRRRAAQRRMPTPAAVADPEAVLAREALRLALGDTLHDLVVAASRDKALLRAALTRAPGSVRLGKSIA